MLVKLWDKEEITLAAERKNPTVVPYNHDLHKTWRPIGWYAFVHLSIPSDNCIKIFETPVKPTYLSMCFYTSVFFLCLSLSFYLLQIGSTSGPSEFADDRSNDLATLKKNIKELGSRSLRRTMTEINAGASSATGSITDYVRQSVSPGKERIDAEMCSNARIAQILHITRYENFGVEENGDQNLFK